MCAEPGPNNRTKILWGAPPSHSLRTLSWCQVFSMMVVNHKIVSYIRSVDWQFSNLFRSSRKLFQCEQNFLFWTEQTRSWLAMIVAASWRHEEKSTGNAMMLPSGIKFSDSSNVNAFWLTWVYESIWVFVFPLRTYSSKLKIRSVLSLFTILSIKLNMERLPILKKCHIRKLEQIWKTCQFSLSREM